ncbi:MAG: hypothetical protein AB1499_06540 [Nitrospirota bacterium]
MNRYTSLILVFVLSHIMPSGSSFAHDAEYRALAPILSAAEKFFISLKAGDYDSAWDLLSDNSHRTIISDVYEATREINEDISRQEIADDFNSRGTMFKNYWNSFKRSFDADMILENSEWEMGIMKQEEAEIVITHNNAEGPTILKMSKEHNTWRVGLTETFWQRKSLKLLHLIFQ